MKQFLKQLKTASIVAVSMFVICGFLYPMSVTLLAQVIFPKQAAGSLIEVDGKVVGSKLVGQAFTEPYYFICRPSAYNYNTYAKAEKETYNGVSSGSDNLASSNPALSKRIEEDSKAFLKANPTVKKSEIPADLLAQSASGLDPHISVEAANVQVDRVSKHSGINKKTLHKFIKQTTTPKVFNVLGEECVNVLELNVLIQKEMQK